MGNKIAFFSKLTKNTGNKKTLWIILIIGAILLLAAPASTDKKETTPIQNQSDGQEYIKILEERLEKTLEQIEGAGKVTVLLTPESFGKISIAKNTKANTSDNNQDFEETVVLSGGDSPVILEEYYPTVGGAIIVASGAETEQVKMELRRAASAALQIGMNRIEVLEGSKKR